MSMFASRFFERLSTVLTSHCINEFIVVLCMFDRLLLTKNGAETFAEACFDAATGFGLQSIRPANG